MSESAMKVDAHAVSPPLPSAYGMSLSDWEEWLSERGQSKFRAKQVVEWIYRKRIASFDEMLNIAVPLREELKKTFSMELLPVSKISGSEDTTRKFLFRLEDGRYVETVMIPASVSFVGERSDRITLCVSSQVGCAYGCKFCASGLAGFTRNLTAGEIVSQVLTAERETGERVSNLVFMGMGEPMANLKQLTKALEILNGQWGVNIGARRITVSTSGLAPQIEKLAQVSMPVRLAISLHGATDEVRDRIMPINAKYNIDRLFQSLAVWKESKKQKITFEYILIDGINDDLEQARILAKRTRALRAKVNLIPYNTVEGLPWERPSEARMQAFQSVLREAGITATLRIEKGHDINAACGQLRLKEETSEGLIVSAAAS